MATLTTMKQAVSIRAATNADGEKIGELSWAAGFTIEGIDWSCVEPNWLVAEYDGDVVGAVQLCPGKPIGRIELLSIDQRLPHRAKSTVVRELLFAACRMLRTLGTQFVSGLVVDARRHFQHVLERRGVTKLAHGTIYLLKVRP